MVPLYLAVDWAMANGAFSVRTSNSLKNMNITTLTALTQKTESEMLRTRNFGTTSLWHVNELLDDYGLSLKGPYSTPPPTLNAIRHMLATIQGATTRALEMCRQIDEGTHPTQ